MHRNVHQGPQNGRARTTPAEKTRSCSSKVGSSCGRGAVDTALAGTRPRVPPVAEQSKHICAVKNSRQRSRRVQKDLPSGHCETVPVAASPSTLLRSRIALQATLVTAKKRHMYVCIITSRDYALTTDRNIHAVWQRAPACAATLHLPQYVPNNCSESAHQLRLREITWS